jgi:hypothetical protein
MRNTIESFSLNFKVVDKDTPIYNVYSIEVLDAMRVRKGDLPEMMEIDKFTTAWDTALPQDWLDAFVKRTKIPYNLVASTTFWCYNEAYPYGFPVSGCKEVDECIYDPRPTMVSLATIR